MKPNPYDSLRSEPLPGGLSREVLDDIRREDPDEEETENTDGDR